MSRAKKSTSAMVKKVRDPARAAAIRRAMIHSLLALLFVAGLGASFYFARGFVEREVAFPSEPPRVILKSQPTWMSDVLADQIVRAARPAGAHSAFDHQLLVDTDRILRASPWIKDVKQVRRVFQNRPGDTLEIDCEYRAPVALVRWGLYFWLVDGEGVKLPAQFTDSQLKGIVYGSDQKVNIRVIEAVREAPVETGQKWPGDDLQAGLDLVKLLYGQPYAEEIVTVNVKNFNGRVSDKEAELTLGTINQTEIRWGRPVNAKHGLVEVAEVSPQRKLEYLKQIYEQFRRVDAHQSWIDIRFDNPLRPVAHGQ